MRDKYESIILVVNRAQLSLALDLYNRLDSIGKKALILTKDDTIVADKKFSSRSFQFYQNRFQFTYSNLMQESYDLFSSLAEEEVDKNLNLRELSRYKGVSLWDSSAQYVLREFLPILYDFNMLETILNSERPREVYVINGINNLERILESICKKQQIPFLIYNTTNRKALSPNKFKILAKKIKRLLVNLPFLFDNRIKSRNLNKKYKVIFFASVERYLSSILPVISKYNNEERLVINTDSSSAKKLQELEIPYMDFYGYKSYGLFNRDARNLLTRTRDTINKNSSFYDKLLYKEVAIGFILRSLFEKLIYEVFPHNMQKIDIVRKILLSYRPQAIVVQNSSVDIVLTAKSLLTPVAAILSDHPDVFALWGCAPFIVDAAVVDGNYWKEYLLEKYLLKEQDIDPNKIRVTGPTKFDTIIDKRFNIKDSKKGTRKNVVFATTYVDKRLKMEIPKCERTEQFRSVCRALTNINEAHLMIKKHPYEKDLNTYKEIIQETGLINYSIVEDAEMLELLHSNCDLLITHVSTASYEAVLLDKNVISLFGSSRFEPEDLWNFRKYGAALVPNNLGEIEDCIRRALFDIETRAKLKAGREKYRYEHAYKLDGNASGRIKEVIDCLYQK